MPNPHPGGPGSLLVWTLPFDLTGMGGPASSQTTAGIALRVTESHKPHHHDKVETLLGDVKTVAFPLSWAWGVFCKHEMASNNELYPAVSVL
jgi:hypothetical protein